MRRRSRDTGSVTHRRRTTRQQRISSINEPPADAPALPDEVQRQIQVAPLFRVTSLDERIWYEPYEATAVAMKGYPLEHVAEQYLRRQGDLEHRTPLSWRELQYRRWQHELPLLLKRDPRFTVFGPTGHGWAEPFSGTWHDEIRIPGKHLTRDTIQQMAKVLAEHTQLAFGEPLSVAELSQVAPPEQPPIAAIKTRSGRLSSNAASVATPPRRDAEQQRRDSDLDDAKAVQHRQLDRIPEMPGYACAVHYEGHAAVSGDIYAVMPYGDQRYLLLIGDVTGHGMQAALIVSPLLKILRLLAPDHPDPVDLLARANDEIKSDLVPGQFVTLAAAVVQTDTDMCELVLAGHHPFAIVNPKHEHPVHRVGKMGMALGLSTGQLFRNSLQPVWLNLQDGDILLQCTDGVLEAQDAQEREFGLTRFWGSALTHADEPPATMVDSIAAEAERFAAGAMDDDVCILALARPLADPDARSATTARTVHSTPHLSPMLTLNGQPAGESIASDELESDWDELEVDEDAPSNELPVQVGL